MTRTIRVTHPSGEVSTRRTEADYTHAVIEATPRADEIETLTRRIRFLEAEGHHLAKRLSKELERVAAFDHPVHFTVVSFHTRRDLAEAKARGRRNRSVVPVDREETR